MNTFQMLNEGFDRKYLKEAEEEIKNQEETDEIEVGDLFLNGDETFKLLDIVMDEDGEVIVNAENEKTGEEEEIEYAPVGLDIEEDEISESYRRKLKESINFPKLRRIVGKLNEAPMSPEDKADTDLLRGIYNKSMKRSNAKLTPEEKAVLDKYNLFRSDTGNIYKNTRPVDWNAELIKPREKDRVRVGRRDTKITGMSNDKVNLADRARKMDTRGGGYEANRVWTQSDPSREFKRDGRYVRLKDKGLLDKERTLQNANMQDKVNSMKTYLGSKKRAEKSLQTIDDRADADIAKLQKQIDDRNRRREWDRKYNSDERDRSQAEINKLLKKESFKKD